jgi:hypothetical protein
MDAEGLHEGPRSFLKIIKCGETCGGGGRGVDALRARGAEPLSLPGLDCLENLKTGRGIHHGVRPARISRNKTKSRRPPA